MALAPPLIWLKKIGFVWRTAGNTRHKCQPLSTSSYCPERFVTPCGSSGFVSTELDELRQRAPNGFGGPFKFSRGHRRQRIDPARHFTARKHIDDFSHA